ncbi:MAG: hypothetical protein EOP06_09335 [Proteobacteria bacterium]|nr:MAG: hypothetical protein EOP06_09335 [Pseudomonadota bacterium]
MSNPDNRELVLRGACEYSKVQQRVRYLGLMQSGQVDKLRSELRVRQETLKASLESMPRLRDRVNEYEARARALSKQSQSLNTDRLSYRDDLKDFSTMGDNKSLQCNFIGVLADVTTDAAYPLHLSDRLKTFNSSSTSKSRKAIMLTHANIEREVVAKLDEIKRGAMNIDACANLANNWMRSMGRVMDEIDGAIADQQKVQQASLAEEPGFPEWSKRMGNIDAERIMLEKLVQFMSVRDQAGSAINRAELNQRTESLKHFIFGTRGALTFAGNSLAFSWIKYTNTLYLTELDRFKKGYDALDAESRVAIANLRTQIPKPSSDREQFTNLNLINLKNFPTSQKRWTIACQRLSALQEPWNASQTYLESMELFCKVAAKATTEQNDIDSALTDACSGFTRLDGVMTKTPDIVSVRTSQTRKGLEAKMAIVASKQSELGCSNVLPE